MLRTLILPRSKHCSLTRIVGDRMGLTVGSQSHVLNLSGIVRFGNNLYTKRSTSSRKLGYLILIQSFLLFFEYYTLLRVFYLFSSSLPSHLLFFQFKNDQNAATKPYTCVYHHVFTATVTSEPHS